MLDRKTYFIREHVGLLKLADTYDILDPQTQTRIGQAREEVPFWSILLRMFINRQKLPTTVSVYEGSEEKPEKLVFSIRRGFTLLRSKVLVVNEHGHHIGYLRQKLLTLGGAFSVFLKGDVLVAVVKGDWKGWNFRFVQNDREVGVISKKWSGLGKEMFTTADSYIIDLYDEPDPIMNTLLLAAGLAVDTIYKEDRD